MVRQAVLLIVVALAVWTGAFVAHGQAAEDAGQVRYVNGTNVNVRSGPGTDTDPVARLSLGRELLVVGKSGNWLQVEISDADGARGWIREDLVSLQPPASRAPSPGLEVPSVEELSTPGGVVTALGVAPRDRVLTAFRVAIRAAERTCGDVTRLVHATTRAEGAYYVVSCKPVGRYSVLVKPDGKMGTIVTPCVDATKQNDRDVCAEE